MIDPVPLLTAQKIVTGQQSNSLKKQLKEGIQMPLGVNIKLLFVFFFDLVSK